MKLLWSIENLKRITILKIFQVLRWIRKMLLVRPKKYHRSIKEIIIKLSKVNFKLRWLYKTIVNKIEDMTIAFEGSLIVLRKQKIIQKVIYKENNWVWVINLHLLSQRHRLVRVLTVLLWRIVICLFNWKGLNVNID